MIEVVLAVFLVSLVLGLSAGLLHVLLRLDRSGRSAAVESSTVGRLSRQFRRDVHAAVAARVETRRGFSELSLELDEGHSVAYRSRTHALERTERRPDAAERLETYRIPNGRDPRFEVRAEDGTTWVALRLMRGDDGDPGTLRPDIGIVADAGRDARFSRSGEESR
jgi:hypothetical protein